MSAWTYDPPVLESNLIVYNEFTWTQLCSRVPIKKRIEKRNRKNMTKGVDKRMMRGVLCTVIKGLLRRSYGDLLSSYL